MHELNTNKLTWDNEHRMDLTRSPRGAEHEAGVNCTNEIPTSWLETMSVEWIWHEAQEGAEQEAGVNCTNWRPKQLAYERWIDLTSRSTGSWIENINNLKRHETTSAEYKDTKTNREPKTNSLKSYERMSVEYTKSNRELLRTAWSEYKQFEDLRHDKVKLPIFCKILCSLVNHVFWAKAKIFWKLKNIGSIF